MTDSETLEALRAVGWTAVIPADHSFTDDYAVLLRYLYIDH